jgi:hypothetical protein
MVWCGGTGEKVIECPTSQACHVSVPQGGLWIDDGRDVLIVGKGHPGALGQVLATLCALCVWVTRVVGIGSIVVLCQQVHEGGWREGLL